MRPTLLFSCADHSFLLRYMRICLLRLGTLYNKQRHHLYRVQHLQFMAACVPPGAASSCGGVASYAISHRLSRLMTVLSFFPLSSESLENIYSSVFQTWLEEFPAYSISHHEHLAKVRERENRILLLGGGSVYLCVCLYVCLSVLVSVSIFESVTLSESVSVSFQSQWN